MGVTDGYHNIWSGLIRLMPEKEVRHEQNVENRPGGFRGSRFGVMRQR
jgi:hypothetical protein